MIEEDFAREIIFALQEEAIGAGFAYEELSSNLPKKPVEDADDPIMKMVDKRLRIEYARGFYEGLVHATNMVKRIRRYRQ